MISTMMVEVAGSSRQGMKEAPNREAWTMNGRKVNPLSSTRDSSGRTRRSSGPMKRCGLQMSVQEKEEKKTRKDARKK